MCALSPFVGPIQALRAQGEALFTSRTPVALGREVLAFLVRPTRTVDQSDAAAAAWCTRLAWVVFVLAKRFDPGAPARVALLVPGDSRAEEPTSFAPLFDYLEAIVDTEPEFINDTIDFRRELAAPLDVLRDQVKMHCKRWEESVANARENWLDTYEHKIPSSASRVLEARGAR